jgi:hypothetical protein
MISTIPQKGDPGRIESYHGRAMHLTWGSTDIIVVAENDGMLKEIFAVLFAERKPNPGKWQHVKVTPYQPNQPSENNKENQDG